ncbi:hypothetical protein GJV85_02210 [Sulfurimonas aquatica]|uniref:Uncharacterized protein n=1 Tax=Sulfurimonas aquatica TaxID=2672570 RepID=A0A975AYM5_9BACT|nr:hypothetical protein [Sulfurimonas aquatica]QSZ40976.1 hypothetical protein GJV85_02210 [Sulfurimonas aquatica]
MINELILNYLIIFVFLEIYEVWWQKANTVMGMLAKMYQHYSKNIFLFFIMHPTFYFAIFFMMMSDYNGYGITLFLIKTADMVLKLILIKQIFIDKEISKELTLAILAPLHPLLPYIGIGLYPPLIYMALM